MTADDFEPRRDGWFEHRGIWDEVTVGTVVGNGKRSEAYEVLATAHGQQVEYGYTLWFQMKNLVTGEVFPVEPKWKVAPVTILTRDPRDIKTPDVTFPVDSEAIMLVVQELGAETMAMHDSKTGEVHCPDYILHPGHLKAPKARQRGLREHLKFAHGLEVVVLDNWEEDLNNLHAKHSGAHKHPQMTGGFPHRHVPEDLDYLG